MDTNSTSERLQIHPWVPCFNHPIGARGDKGWTDGACEALDRSQRCDSVCMRYKAGAVLQGMTVYDVDHVGRGRRRRGICILEWRQMEDVSL